MRKLKHRVLVGPALGGARRRLEVPIKPFDGVSCCVVSTRNVENHAA